MKERSKKIQYGSDIFLVRMSYCAFFSQGFFFLRFTFFVKRKSAAKDKRHCYYSLYCLFFSQDRKSYKLTNEFVVKVMQYNAQDQEAFVQSFCTS